MATFSPASVAHALHPNSMIKATLTQKNVAKWVEKANAVTTNQLIEEVKAEVNKGAAKAIEDKTAKTVSTMTFKLHKDQRQTVEAAIEKAQAQGETEVSSVALEYICMDFLSGPTAKKGKKAKLVPSDLPELFALINKNSKTTEGALKIVFEAFEQIFPTVDKALSPEFDSGTF